MEVSTLDIHAHQIQGSYFHGFHIRVPYGIRGLFLNILVHGVAGGRRLGDVPWGRSTIHPQDISARLRLLKITEREPFGDQARLDELIALQCLMLSIVFGALRPWSSELPVEAAKRRTATFTVDGSEVLIRNNRWGESYVRVFNQLVNLACRIGTRR